MIDLEPIVVGAVYSLVLLPLDRMALKQNLRNGAINTSTEGLCVLTGLDENKLLSILHDLGAVEVLTPDGDAVWTLPE